MIVRKKSKQRTEFEITPDTKLLLVIETNSGAEGITNRLSLASYVEEVVSADSFLIQMPVHRGYNHPLPRDEPILMYLLSKSRMYSMSAIFVEHVRHDGLLFAKMRRCSPIKPDQRRDCYRLPCEMPVLVEPVKACGNKTEPAKPYECQMIDFSDGGMLFSAKEAFAVGEKVSLAFNIGTDEVITAEVLRCKRIERSERSERIKAGQSTVASYETPNKTTNATSKAETITATAENPGSTNGRGADTYSYKSAVKFIHKCKKQKNRFYKFIVEQQRAKMRLLAEQQALEHNGQGGDFHAKTKQA